MTNAILIQQSQALLQRLEIYYNSLISSLPARDVSFALLCKLERIEERAYFRFCRRSGTIYKPSFFLAGTTCPAPSRRPVVALGEGAL